MRQPRRSPASQNLWAFLQQNPAVCGIGIRGLATPHRLATSKRAHEKFTLFDSMTASYLLNGPRDAPAYHDALSETRMLFALTWDTQMKRLFLVILSFLGFCTPASGQSRLPLVAEKLAVSLNATIKEAHGNTPCHLAVFPFGDADGDYEKEQGIAPILLQGELTHTLKATASTEILVVGPEALKSLCVKQKVDITAIGPQSTNAIKEFLSDVHLDAAIVGSCGIPKTSATDANTKVSATIVFSSGEIKTTTQPWSSVDILPFSGVAHLDNDTQDLPAGDISGRFSVTVYVDGRERTLHYCADRTSPFWNVRFLKLLPQDRGKAFTVKLANNGAPYCKWKNDRSLDEQRLFAVALMLDGVNSIWDSDSNGSFSPTRRYPFEARKWVLSSPGWVLTKDSQVPEGYRRVRVSSGQADHSVQEVKGFQKGSSTASKFVFGPAETSVAARIGTFDQLGMISAVFYGEALPDDAPLTANLPKGTLRARSAIGVNAGAEIPHKTFKVTLRLRPDPVEVWRIFYYLDERSLPPTVTASSLKPVSN